MNKYEDPGILIFADEGKTSLTLGCQETLNKMLVNTACKLAEEEGNPYNLSQRICEYYYSELAHFMMLYPRVLIELVLLKPDFSDNHP